MGRGEEVRRCSTAVLVRVHLKLQARMQHRSDHTCFDL